MTKLIVAGIAIVLAVGILISVSPFTVIGAGQVGVVTTWGKFSRTLEPGFHWISPISEDVKKFDVQVQKEQTDADAASSDLQTVNTTIAVNYEIDPAKVGELYVQIGADYKSRIIDPAVQEVVKAVTSKYTAQELQSKRSEVSTDMKAALSVRLQQYFIIVRDISVVNFSYSPSFNRAIEEKVTAEQNALTEQNNLKASQFKAQAIKITSEAANNEKYIQLQELEVQAKAIEKWNGVLPSQMIPGAALPFINVGK